ncbi:MAG TPA: hypothetical protein VFA39_20130 [Steroidobacteraceae bacterium]|nr:hypothetical protein [Steroidobacteraceae bacterium]
MRYINASEVGPWTYCKKQWQLAGKKRPSTPVRFLRTSDPRLLGIRAHSRHAQRVQEALEHGGILLRVGILIVLALAGAYVGTLLGPML